MENRREKITWIDGKCKKIKGHEERMEEGMMQNEKKRKDESKERKRKMDVWMEARTEK